MNRLSKLLRKSDYRFHCSAEILALFSARTGAYTPTMKCVFSCFLLLITNLNGRPLRVGESKPVGEWFVAKQVSPTPEQEVDSTLAALKEAGASQSRLSQSLAQVMMRLAENNQRPPLPVVVNFTDKLTRLLVGKQMNNAQRTAMRECILEVMRRTGTSNAGLASRFQQTLIGIGVDSSKTQPVVRDFILIREAVQGPDDSPVIH